MKNFIYAVLVLFLTPFVYADNISMVTYFPVPYMTYKDLQVSDNCALGLIDSCKLDSKGDLNVSGTLSVNKGKLYLNGPTVLSLAGDRGSINFGTNSGTSSDNRGVVFFNKQNLTVNGLQNTSLKNLQATQANLQSLQLGSYAFPVCGETNRGISYQDLTLERQTGTFLVCGSGACSGYDSQECCTAAGFSWQNNSCVRSCSAKSYSEQVQTYPFGRGDAGGDAMSERRCDVDTVLATVSYTTGISQQCSLSGELNMHSLAEIKLYLTCESEANSIFPIRDEWESFSCIFVEELPAYAEEGSCVGGALTCTAQTDTWTCPAAKACGEVKNSCSIIG